MLPRQWSHASSCEINMVLTFFILWWFMYPPFYSLKGTMRQVKLRKSDQHKVAQRSQHEDLNTGLQDLSLDCATLMGQQQHHIRCLLGLQSCNLFELELGQSENRKMWFDSPTSGLKFITKSHSNETCPPSLEICLRLSTHSNSLPFLLYSILQSHTLSLY